MANDCFIMYDISDGDYAIKVQKILESKLNLQCFLQYKSLTGDMAVQIFELALGSKCVISLLTKQLVKNSWDFAYHRKIHTLMTEKDINRFLAVRVDLDEAVFKEQCRYLINNRVINMDNADFESTLVDVVSHVIDRVIKDESYSNQVVDAISSGKTSYIRRAFSEDNLNAFIHLHSSASFAESCRFDNQSRSVRPGISSSALSTPSDEARGTVSKQNNCRRSSSPRLISNLDISRNSQSYKPAFSQASYESCVASGAFGATNQSKLGSGQQYLLPSAELSLATIENIKMGILIGEGSTGKVSKATFTYGLDKHEMVIAVKVLSPEHDDNFSREITIKSLKSPFLLPILHTVEEYSYKLYIIYPYMENGNLEVMIDPNQRSKNEEKCKKWEMEIGHGPWLTKVMFQVSEAIDFLHINQFVHGDIHPANILLDIHFNARLGDGGLVLEIDIGKSHVTDSSKMYGRLGYKDEYYNVGDNKKRPENDVYNFGIIILQCLKWAPAFEDHKDEATGLYNPMNLPSCIRYDYKGVFPSATILSADLKYVDKKIWQNKELALSITGLAVNCIAPPFNRIKSNAAVSQLKELLKKNSLPFIIFPGSKCIYCLVNEYDKRRQPYTKCPVDCPFNQICRLCLTAVGSKPLNCPCHSGSIDPQVGGKNSFAILIAGKDERYQHALNSDVTGMYEVLIHPAIIGIPRENVKVLTPSSTPDAIKGMFSEITNANLVVLYYSGHPGFETASVKLPPVKLMVRDDVDDSLHARYIQKELKKLNSPRILVMFDCCHSGSLEVLPTYSNDENDSYIQWHAQWFSSQKKEKSTMKIQQSTGKIESTFTKYILAGLKGAKRCLVSNEASATCEMCERFNEQCRMDHNYITLQNLQTFVNCHMQEKERRAGRGNQRESTYEHLSLQPRHSNCLLQPISPIYFCLRTTRQTCTN